jgi:hypothetical protein
MAQRDRGGTLKRLVMQILLPEHYMKTSFVFAKLSLRRENLTKSSI